MELLSCIYYYYHYSDFSSDFNEIKIFLWVPKSTVGPGVVPNGSGGSGGSQEPF